MTPTWIRPLFLVAALYDGVLGVLSVVVPMALFALFGVTPPNHMGYVQFPALLLVIFAAMFYRIAADPVANRALMPYGIALKVAYSGLVFFHQVTGGIPSMWVPWAWIDVMFVLLFVAAYRLTSPAVRT
jgi:hypothetical protein